MKQHVKLYEEYSQESQFFKTREEIEQWLNDMENIDIFNINDDLSVDAGNVYIYDKELTYFPVQFRRINGHFNCGMNHLTSLKGCPMSIKGNFIFWQNELTSLEYCPQEVGGYIDCDVNHLTSLVFAPKKPKHYNDNPCGRIYNQLGFNSTAHIKALLEIDPNPKETMERLKSVYPKRYNDIIKKSRELRFKLGLESEELQNTYNKVTDIEKGYF